MMFSKLIKKHPTTKTKTLYNIHSLSSSLNPQNQNPNTQTTTIITDPSHLTKLITSHQNPSTLNSFLSKTNIKLTHDLVSNVLTNLTNAGVLALSFFKWVEKSNNFKHDTSTYNALIDSLGKIKQFKVIWTLVNEMETKRVLGKSTFLIISRRYARVKKAKEALDAFDRMKGFGFKAELDDFNRFFDVLCKARLVGTACDVFDEMKRKKRFRPDIKTYSVLLEGWCQEMNLLKMDEVFRVIEEMRRCRIGPNSRTFDIIIHHLVKGRKTEEAYSVFTRMRDEFVCEPSVSTYEIMVRMFCNDGRIDMALKVWEEMKGEGVLPGMHMFSTLINNLCREKKLDDACKYFNEMLDAGIRPPAYMFNRLKQALVDDGKEDAVTALTHRLEKLKTLLVIS